MQGVADGRVSGRLCVLEPDEGGVAPKVAVGIAGQCHTASLSNCTSSH